ncbi:HAD family hydrolase [Peptoniphilus lacrimalis]|uniref:HAD hydrolase, family IA, variant 3 n=1 Tax=Peptoniphilus lacrimalis 315-B TaxID=596330 RepID=D1VUY8_9FIRM|nr:HAD-IA family hydrolase [Peptoniphilus lacrimalis]EFA89650.1 HAD hydrolase, family IA, variant 3 [Peptoniphilus lacrimalis 315-B]
MKLIIFDLDGTLVDSMGYWRNLSTDFLKKMGLTLKREDEDYMTTLNLKLSTSFLIDKFNLDMSYDSLYNTFKEQIVDFYSNKVQLKDGALETLEFFKDKSYKVVIGTSTNKEFAKIPIEKYDLKKYIENIYTVESQTYAKNDPNFFKSICQENNILPEDAILVDDSVIALRNAKKAGLVTVGIYDENSKDTFSYIKAENPYSIIKLTELKNI